MNKSTRQAYIEELARLQQKVVEMGMSAAEAVSLSMKALVENDKKLAEEVMKNDDVLDDMIVDIEDRCILMIAKQQPIAHDLRVIATGFKISTDLERIGDHAFDIAKTAKNIDGALLGNIVDTPKLAACAVNMVEMAIDAYRLADIRLAEKVCRADDEMDSLFASTFEELSKLMMNDTLRTKQQATQLIFIARFLERIGDHATNIAEWVIYLETAERIRKTKGKKNELLQNDPL